MSDDNNEADDNSTAEAAARLQDLFGVQSAMKMNFDSLLRTNADLVNAIRQQARDANQIAMAFRMQTEQAEEIAMLWLSLVATVANSTADLIMNEFGVGIDNDDQDDDPEDDDDDDE